MKPNFDHALTVILLFAFILALCSCTTENARPDGKLPQPTVTSTEKPKIVGTELKDGVIDVSDSIITAIGDGYAVKDSTFFYEDTLLIAAEGSENSILALYDIRTAKVTMRYELPFSIQESTNYTQNGAINVCANKLVIIDFINGNVFELNKELKEIAHHPDAAPRLEGLESYSMSIAYSESDNAIYYSEPELEAVIYKKSIDDNAVSEFFKTGNPNDHLSFIATDDCAYLNVRAYNYSVTGETTEESLERYYVVDAATGEVKLDTWLNHNVYSDGEYYAESNYYKSLSYIKYGNVSIDIDYMQEFSLTTLKFDGKTAISAMNAHIDDTNTIVYSAYSLENGERISRIMFKVAPWEYITRGYITNSIASECNGLYCLAYSDSDENGASTKTCTLIWNPTESVDEDITGADEGLIANPKSAIPDTEITIETNAAYARDIESRYPVNVYYDETADNHFDETAANTTTYKTFSESSDPRYVYEVLRLLDDVLAQYPDGMLEQLSDSVEGKMCFYLIMDLKDSSIPFEVSGLYITSGDTQDFVIDVTPSGFDRFASGGVPTTIYSELHHEICHGIQRAIFDNTTGDTVYDYETYESYWPDDYKFDDEENQQKYVFCDPEDAYFVDDYAATAIVEDMSRMYEYAMWDILPEQIFYPHVNARYKYFCELIRSTFDKDDVWGDTVMPWERAIAA